METFLTFLVVGFLAQLVDGALGMAYGLVSSSVLIALGVPPATASASVHAAKVFTTCASAISHTLHKNVTWRLFFPLASAGVVGGLIGTALITSVETAVIKPWVLGYFAVMGFYIIWRAWRRAALRHLHAGWMGPLGMIGGFLDAIGGGGWGPTVTTTMLGAGVEPRQAIGTVNTAEFFVSVAVVSAFVYALLSGHWTEGGGLEHHTTAVVGLIVGGLCAAPLAGWSTKIIPMRPMTFAVGALVVALAGWQASQLFLRT